MEARHISFGRSINVLDYYHCATVHISQLPNGTWDTSERFEQEWNEMAREMARRGFSPITDEPSVTYSTPITAEGIVVDFELHYLHRVADYVQFDLTALEAAPAALA